MGVVYEAENPKIGSRAAIKLLHARFAQDEEYATRFLNEARAVNVIRHRGLVEISDFGKLADGTLYYVMEYLTGDSLFKRIAERRGPFPPQEAVAISVQVARALAAAARKEHRPSRPQTREHYARDGSGESWSGSGQILDFRNRQVSGKQGSADRSRQDRRQHPGRLVYGNAALHAPEQHGRAEEVDGRADVFHWAWCSMSC